LASVEVKSQMSDKDPYIYQSDADLAEQLVKEISLSLEPFFDSYEKDKWVCSLQIINLILVLTASHFFLKPVLDLLLRGVENVSLISLEIFLLLLITITLGLQKKILILRWHTLFKMEGRYTRKWFWRLIVLNLIIYYIPKNIYGSRKP